MRVKYLILVLCLLLALLLVGCNDQETSTPTGDESNGADNSTTDDVVPDFTKTDTEMFTERDLNAAFDAASAVTVQLNGDSIQASSDAVRISGTTAVISAEATYVISGTLSDGQLVVDATDTAKIQLVFNNVHINSATSAPLYIKGGDKVFLTLSAGSVNTLSNGGSFVAVDDNNIDGALFSKQDLTLNGTGSLTVTSPAGHGIVCKDDLVLTGGSISVTAASHGLDANDSVRLGAATLTVQAGKDAIHAENTEDAALGFVYASGGSLTATVSGDGIDAGAYIQVESGTLDIKAGEGASSSDSTKGLKATSGLLINDGTVIVSSTDDCLHSNASLFINGGSLTLSGGDDGVHADETLKITAGTIVVTKSYEGLEGLDIVISGGDISLVATDDGINAAGGADGSGFGGVMGNDQFGRPGGGRSGGGGPGGHGGGMSSSSSNGSILISGGTVRVRASGDGIDANGTLEITGGFITVCGPTQGDTATLDYDVSGTISGGTFIGTGASGMAQTFSDSEQGVIAVNVGTQSAGTSFVLTDEAGNVIVEYAPELSYAVVIYSSSALVKGESYIITIGEISGTFTAS